MSAKNPTVVIDTSVLVAAAFKPRSDSARIVEQVRRGTLRLMWDEPTRVETERIFRKIPPLSWEAVSGLFAEANRRSTDGDLSAFKGVPDPDDRKFAALAAATRATLLTLDEHLLGAADGATYTARTPSEFLRRLE